MKGMRKRTSGRSLHGMHAPAVMAALVLVMMYAGVVAAASTGPDTVKVFVSILPQAYFVERIGGDDVQVEVLVGPGQSPHTYEPTPKQMARLGDADIFFRIGIPLEKSLVPKISRSFPGLLIVDTRKGVTLLASDPRGHDHDEAGAPDPHIWLDPKRVMIQSMTICDALVRFDPARAAKYEKNLETFMNDLSMLDHELQRVFTPLRKSRVYVFHPAFGYLADAYGFTQVPVEVGGKEPGARQLADLIARARADRVRVIFIQPQFSRIRAQAVAREIGGAVVPIDPLPKDYMSEMMTLARTIRDSLKGN